MKRTVFTLISFMLAFGGLFTPMTAIAADVPLPVGKPLHLETSPLPINLVADPGKTVTTDLRVRQGSGEDARLKVSLMKFAAYGEEGKPRLVDREPGDDYFDWVKFDKTSFNAPNNVWQTVKMTISVPKAAAFGYYYAVVFSRVGDDVRREKMTTLAGGTAVLVLLEARNPNAKRTLELASLSTKHRVYEFLPAEIDVKLANTGNVHGIPHGDVFITQGKKQVAALPINAHGGNILPGSKRIYPVEWKDGFPHYDYEMEDGKIKLDKNGKQVKHLKWDLAKLMSFRMGKYTAHLFAVYDDGSHDVPLEAEVSFWVIPWRFLLVVLVALALVGLGVYAMVRGTLHGAARGARRMSGRGRR